MDDIEADLARLWEFELGLPLNSLGERTLTDEFFN
jgi:hypothetical protein